VTFRRMSVPERAAIGFGRLANTKPGLIVFISLTLLLTFWSLLHGHRALCLVLLVLSASLGGQLWRLEGGQLGARPTPPTPAETT